MHSARTDNVGEKARANHAGVVWTVRVLLLAAAGFLVVTGTPLLRVAAGCAALFAVIGDADGLTRNVFRFGSLAAAVVAAPVFGISLGDWISTNTSMSFLPARIVGVGGVAMIVMILFSIVGSAASRRIRRVRWLNTADHSLGLLTGAAEGGLLVVVLCWVLQTFGPSIAPMLAQLKERPGAAGSIAAAVESVQAMLRDDAGAEWIGRYNPLTGLEMVRATREFVDVASNPRRIESLTNDEKFRGVYELPELQRYVRAFHENRELRAAVERRDLGEIMRTETFREMMNDKELFAALTAHFGDFQEAVSRASSVDIGAASVAGGQTARRGAGRVERSSR